MAAMAAIFQFTPLREGRQNEFVVGEIDTNFNSRPCGRGDVYRNVRGRGMYLDFNSRPCGRGDIWTGRGTRRTVYFNSRPCGRGDGGSRSGHHHQDSISIHAPAGGATKPMPRLVDWQQISIHAPAGGATSPAIVAREERKISIHAPAGGATLIGKKIVWVSDISIHAPAGGATGELFRALCTKVYFNSRPCGRGDSKRVQKKKMTIVPFAEKRGKFILL